MGGGGWAITKNKFEQCFFKKTKKCKAKEPKNIRAKAKTKSYTTIGRKKIRTTVELPKPPPPPQISNGPYNNEN